MDKILNDQEKEKELNANWWVVLIIYIAGIAFWIYSYYDLKAEHREHLNQIHFVVVDYEKDIPDDKKQTGYYTMYVSKENEFEVRKEVAERIVELEGEDVVWDIRTIHKLTEE